MRSMSIGVEPIAVTSLYPTPQTVSEGSFAQSLQDAVDAGSVTQVTEPQVQTNTPAESTPQQPAQDAAPQEAPQAAAAEAPQGQTQSSEQTAQQETAQEQTQSVPQEETQSPTQSPAQDMTEAQPAEQLAPEPTEQAAEQPAVQPQTETHFQPQLQTVPQTETEKAQQTDQTVNIPTQLAGVAEPDPELMKELADLLGRNQEMLTAPQRMRRALENMIVQALNELSDPEKQEEEFTEMVLDFLMEFIDRKFGGETEETSMFADNAEKDDDDNIKDVLLQAVVQMLDDIRSENAQSEAPQPSEDEEAVEAIPSTNMAKEYVGTTANQLLSEEAKQMVELDSFTEAPQTAAEPQTEPQAQEQPKPVEIPDEIPLAQAEEADTQLYQAARQTAEAIFTEITQSEPEQQPMVQPVEELQSQPQEQPVEQYAVKSAEKAQPQEQLYQQAAVQPVEQNQSPVIPPEQLQTMPVKAERSREAVKVYPAQPAEELEELTRLVRHEALAPAHPRIDPRKGEVTPIRPIEMPGVISAAVQLETAVTSQVPQIALARVFEGSESGAEQIVTQIVSEIFNQLPENGGTTTFVMTLNPESLGKVTVKLVEEAGKISVSVTAHEKRTAEILSQRFDTLQTAMKENGTQLEKYQVVYAPEKDEGAAHQNFDGSSKNPYVKQDDEESEDNGEFAEFLQQVV